MANRHEWRRSLWGVDPDEAQRRLAEHEEPLRRERAALERAVALAEAETERLTTECAQLEEQIRYAGQRLTLIRQGISRQRSLAPTHSLALNRQMAALEREHAHRVDQVRRKQEALRAEIEERRRKLHLWVMELLRSVAGRGAE
ncbi:MAG: hypothetical protein ACOY94_29000 [Bacillota bacterium]